MTAVNHEQEADKAEYQLHVNEPVAKSTPGPWVIEEKGVCFSIKHGTMKHRCGPCQKEPVAIAFVSKTATLGQVALSNARLIAAAPDLLEALEAIENHIKNGCEDYMVGQQLRNKMRAAIAKARGAA
jgi:hypothetical protein